MTSQMNSCVHPLRISQALFALLVLSVGETPAQSPRTRFDTLFEPWKSSSPRGTVPVRRGQRDPADASPRRTPFASPEYGSEIGSGSALVEHLRRRVLEYTTNEAAGTIIVDTANTHLYLVLGNGHAVRYGIGVGREGFAWSGRERVSRMAEWPDWRPPAEMIARDPGLPSFVPGGLDNPLGARALYLGDTLYRIHGTNDPSSIGTFKSSGCIRMLNADVIDLYQRVAVGTPVVVLTTNTNGSAQSR